MNLLIHLMAAVALLVWGAHMVRSNVMRLCGDDLRQFLSARLGCAPRAMCAGMAVTCVMQSSTATCVMTTSFLSKGLMSTAVALAVMLGADVGSSLMALILSSNLAWFSPLLILTGVVVSMSRPGTHASWMGKCILGVGLMSLALHLIVNSTRPMIQSPEVHALLKALPDDVLLHMVVGALFTVLAYSSLATVLLVATLHMQGLLPVSLALGLILGANLGSGLVGMILTAKSPVKARRLPLGNFIFKLVGCLFIIPVMPYVPQWVAHFGSSGQIQMVGFHVAFNTALAVCMLGCTQWLARLLDTWWVAPTGPQATARPQHLDPLALSTPSLAICCAAREALHLADMVETMVRGVETVIRTNDLILSERLRKMDDVVDNLYHAIKFYLTQISRKGLTAHESRRWADILSFTINMEQIGDIVERILENLEEKKIRKNRRFSEAGMAEIIHLHERLVANLRLSMTVFLDGQVVDASRLLEEKARFRDLEHSYAASHITRLQDNTTQSIETSALHLDLISELKRINSHICCPAYPILQNAGVLTPTRLRIAIPAPLIEDLAA